MSKRGHRGSVGGGGRGKKRGTPPVAPPALLPNDDAREPLTKVAGRLKAAVEAAKTLDEFEDARAAVRHTLSPREIEQTDLWAVCEHRRLEFYPD